MYGLISIIELLLFKKYPLTVEYSLIIVYGLNIIWIFFRYASNSIFLYFNYRISTKIELFIAVKLYFILLTHFTKKIISIIKFEISCNSISMSGNFLLVCELKTIQSKSKISNLMIFLGRENDLCELPYTLNIIKWYYVSKKNDCLYCGNIFKFKNLFFM